MSDKIFHSLKEVFADTDMDELLREPAQPYKAKVKHDFDIDNFKEITEWVKINNREPIKTPELSTERTLFNKLNGIRKNGDLKNKLLSYDEMNLLTKTGLSVTSNNVIPEKYHNLDDALSGMSDLLDMPDDLKKVDEELFDTTNIKKPIKMSDKKGTRVTAKNFEQFEPLFKKVQSEIASGKRQIVDFKNYDIQIGRFYVLNGLLTYVDSVGEEFLGSDNQIDARMHIVFENGTESQMLRRAFGSSMYGRGGKIITEIEDGKIDLKNDILTGSIYVLRSLSQDPKIMGIKNLYKVGYTDGLVSKRVANAKNESTYLYAPVEIVENFQIYNVDVHGFETLLHHRLADMQLQVEIESPNGGIITPKEWFVIDLNELIKTINEISVELNK